MQEKQPHGEQPPLDFISAKEVQEGGLKNGGNKVMAQIQAGETSAEGIENRREKAGPK